MTDAPVTVVIPLYNKAREISRALESVLAQTRLPAAVVVVDDGSTDDGPRRVEALGDPRVRLVRQTNAGPGPARNRGIAEAGTEWVALLDADDEWMPGFLEEALRTQARFPGAGLWAVNYRMVPEGGGASQGPLSPRFVGLPDRLPEEPFLIDDFFICLDGDCPVCSSNVLLRRAIFDECGMFSGETRIGEDWDMWFRIAVRYPIAFSPSVQAVYRLDASNRAMHRGRLIPGVGTLLDSMVFEGTIRAALEGDGLPSRYRESVERLLAKRLVLHAKAAIVSGRGALARELLAEARAYRLVREHWWRLWLQSFLGVTLNRLLNVGRNCEIAIRKAIRP